MDLMRLTTSGDEELALAVIEFSVGRRAAGPGCCGDWFNCLNVKHGQLRRKLTAPIFSALRSSTGISEDGRRWGCFFPPRQCSLPHLYTSVALGSVHLAGRLRSLL